MASQLNLTTANGAALIMGDDISVVITLKDSDGATPAVITTPNITGRTYASQIRTTAISGTILATFTVTVTDGAAGKLTMTMGKAVTAALSPVAAVFDIQETNGATVTTIISGTVDIVSDVTR